MNRFNDYKSESGARKPHAPAAVTAKAKTKPTPDTPHNDTLKNKMHCDDEKTRISTSKNQNQKQKP